MTVSTVDSISEARLDLPPALAAWLRVLAIAGALLLVLGAFAAPDRLWPSFLIMGYFVFGIGAGALYFLAMFHGASGGWGTVFKRVPEALLILVPVGGGLILAGLAGDFLMATLSQEPHRLYPWMVTSEAAHHGPEVHSFKDVWLQPMFFYARAILIIVGVSLFARSIRMHSIEQDRDGSTEHSVIIRRRSIQFLVFGTLLLASAAIDWFMSLEPAWYSTMYIVYHFAGNFVTALAVVILILLGLRGLGFMQGFTTHHLHDLGKLLFGMSTFWMYIWFSQFMLIWYTNMPEETIYFTNRLGEGRTAFLVALPILMWVIPFFTLLSQRAKKSTTVMSRICVVVLLGHWLDLFLMAGGQAASGGFAVAEVGAGLAAVALVFLLPSRQLTRAPLVATKDPYLKESLHHHV